MLVVRGQRHGAAGTCRGADLRAHHAGEHPGRAGEAGQRADKYGGVKAAEPSGLSYDVTVQHQDGTTTEVVVDGATGRVVSTKVDGDGN